MKSFLAVAWLVNVLAATSPALAGAVGIVAAPAGEELSKDYAVQVEGKDLPVYLAKVAPADPVKRWEAMDDKAHSAEYFDHASFAYFDMEWTLRVYHCDAARIRNVRFEDLRIEESPRLISLWIGKAVWTRDEQRGHIEGVSFKNIQAQADPLRVELKGFDASHRVEQVLFDNVVVNGRPLAPEDVRTNAFVTGIRFGPDQPPQAR